MRNVSQSIAQSFVYTQIEPLHSTGVTKVTPGYGVLIFLFLVDLVSQYMSHLAIYIIVCIFLNSFYFYIRTQSLIVHEMLTFQKCIKMFFY